MTDGSHHAAALVRQLVAQGREFKCKATITKYAINENALAGLSKEFFLFVADNDCDKEDIPYYLSLTLSNMEVDFATLSFPRSGKNFRLYVVPKNQTAISNIDMQRWIESCTRAKTMIDMFEFVKYSSDVLDKHTIQCTEGIN